MYQVIYVILQNRQLWLIITLVCIDFLTGGSKAIVRSEVNSSVGLKGIIKHLNVLLTALFVCVMNHFIPDEITGFSLSVINLFIIYNYLISIVENLHEIGVPLPNFIKSRLERTKNTLDEKE